MSAMVGAMPGPGRWPKLGKSIELTDKSTHLSCNKLNGHFDPGGNSGFSGVVPSAGGGGLSFDEFPAFPDFTIPFRGGIELGVHVTFSPRDPGILLTVTTCKSGSMAGMNCRQISSLARSLPFP